MRTQLLIGALGAALTLSAVACDKKKSGEATPEKVDEAPAKAGEAPTKADKAEAAPEKADEAPAKADNAEANGKKPEAPKEAAVGAAAPDFTLTDLEGKAHTLSDFKGKTVVIEWYNPDCPYVVAAHKKGPLKDLAKRQMDKGVVWLAVNSGAPGKQGAGAERNKKSVEEYGLKNAVLLDPDGKVGKMYGAKSTPHMYVIDKTGKLVYRGALDNAPLGETKEGQEYKNYVELALADVEAGRDVKISETKSWGCSVKYAF